MDNEAPVVIDVRNVKKKFRVYYDRGLTLKEKILFQKRRAYEERWVLKGVTFQVRKGEAVGIIGENGCGKSTTLKLLTKILYPNGGTIKMKGRISSLIELGAGFHPDMSGRENIYTNAAIFGLKRDEIEKRLQGIIDFSELGAYIDNPVRTYSSGMYMRLAFAVAINVDADILLIDEILAVGDAGFQTKCFNKLREIKRNGTTIVIVSHSLGQIEQICERCLWIENGVVRKEGYPAEVHSEYLRFLSERAGTLSGQGETSGGDGKQSGMSGLSSDKRWGSRDIVFTSISVLNENGQLTNRLLTGKPFSIRMTYLMNKPVDDIRVGIGIFRNDGLQCYGTNTLIDHQPVEITAKRGCVSCLIEQNNLLDGEYILDVSFERNDGFAYDFYRECQRFIVMSDIRDEGVARLEHTWQFSSEGEENV